MAKLVALVHNKIDYCASVVCYCHCWSNQWWPHINQTTSVVAQPLLLNESHRAQTTLKTSDRCATMLRFLKKCKCILSQLMDPHHSSWRPKSRRRAKHSWMFIHCVKTRLTLLIKEVNSQVFPRCLKITEKSHSTLRWFEHCTKSNILVRKWFYWFSNIF